MARASGADGASGPGRGVVTEGRCGGVRGAENFLPIEGKPVSAHPKIRSGDADNGDGPVGPVGYGGAESHTTTLELLVAGGNPRCPDAGQVPAQRTRGGDGALGQGPEGLGEGALRGAGGQGR